MSHVRTFISSATGSSTPATATGDTAEVTACSWAVVPMMSDYAYWLSCSPFCMYHSLTSAVRAAKIERPSAVLSPAMDFRNTCKTFADLLLHAELKNYQKKNSLQLISSVPSWQSRHPLHFDVSDMHVPLPQRNWLREHATQIDIGNALQTYQLTCKYTYM